MQRHRRAALGWVAAGCMLPSLLGAQEPTVVPSSDELARVRDAAEREAVGDYAAAEALLTGVLALNPRSLSALLVLDRVYQVQGRADAVLPFVRRLLEDDPRSALGHQLLLRAYGALDSLAAVERTGAEWMRVAPRLETPYREVARIWLQRNEPQRALHVLAAGRERIGASALALELGDAHVALGDLDRAVVEWDRAIGRDGQGFMLVQRRLRGLPDGGAAIVPGLLQRLTAAGGAPGRQRAALQLALDAGRGAEAESIARPLLAMVPRGEQEAFLADVARRADGADLAAIAYWAYGELTRRAEADTVRLLALRTRLAQLALELGDTTRAARLYGELEQAGGADSPQRRQAVAVRLQLAARAGDARDAARELGAFRTEFPQAPELDETAAAIADALLRQGEADAAEAALLGVRGPRSSLARGRAFLRRGDLPRAAAEFMLAAPALHGAEGTRTIALAAALTRLSPRAGELLGTATARAREDAGAAALDLVEQSHGLPGGERGAVLEFAASLAEDAALPQVAEQVRRELVTEHPRSDAAPAALLWLARRAVGTPGQREEARVLLETLILEHPRSALVPHARRELDRIMNGAAGSGRKAGDA